MRFLPIHIWVLSALILAAMSGPISSASDATSSASNKKPPNRVYYLPGFKILIKPKPAPEPPKSPTDDLIIVRPVPLW